MARWWQSGSILLMAPWLLGVDVERPPIVIEPPRVPHRSKPSGQQPPETTVQPIPQPRSPFLRLPGPLKLDLDAALAEPLPLPERKAESEQERTRRRLREFLASFRAEEKVRRGMADSAWADLARRVDHYFEPDFHLVREERISAISLDWFKDAVFRTLRGWYLDNVTNRNLPFHCDPEDATCKEWDGLLYVNQLALSDPNWGNDVVTLVQVRFGGGTQPSAEIVGRSGHPLYDQAALDSVVRALKNDWGDEAPPDPGRALMALRSHYVILPPLPIVGVSFDAWFGDLDFIYPLKKMVSTKIELVALLGAEERADSKPETGAP